MAADQRGLLQVLRSELDFLKKGGYRRPSWRPQFIFQDSPTCLNYLRPRVPKPCSECVLVQLVPPERRNEKVPCRHIPLNELGETMDSLYPWATQDELEAVLAQWLLATIRKLEREKGGESPTPSHEDETTKVAASFG